MFMQGVTKIVQDTVLEGVMPAKVVAARIGKPYSTLLREINPFDEGAKIGAETMLEIMKVTGDVRALEHIASELGLKLVPKGNYAAAAGMAMEVRAQGAAAS
jgi:hypothetical protein